VVDSSPEAVIDRLFPVKYQAQLPAALRKAYDAVNQTMTSVDYLGIETGQQLRGHLIGAAVDYQVLQLMLAGLLPDAYHFPPNRRRTAVHLELITADCIVTFSQVLEPTDFPRFAHFRENLRLNNQLTLPLREFQDAAQNDAKPHVVLTHGHGQLEFICLGLPHSRERMWSYRKNLLTADLSAGASSEPAVTPIEDRAFGTLKKTVQQELHRWLDEKDAG
jgi:hypothetical protein